MTKRKSEFSDPFEAERLEKGYGKMDDQGEEVTMVLGHKEVRRCAFNPKTFQSGGTVGRIVIPSEEKIRTIRQIPFEVDPPLHKDYRDLVEPWFKRPLEKEYTQKLQEQIESIVAQTLKTDVLDVISEFALPLQSRALTLLLNVPFAEAETWISWGTHVFRSEDTALDGDKANILYDYLDVQIDKAIANPGDDLYSLLLGSQVSGKTLTKEEVKGVMILTFAGGRDTVINAVTNSICYFAEHPEAIEKLCNSPELIPFAVEELMRYFSPLTQMGRVSTEAASVCEHALKADSKIGLCWASANRDAKVFENANQVVLDRKLNPHLAFGSGVHNCLGATHARQLLKILIQTLIKHVNAIDIISSKENIEDLGVFKRKVGFNQLEVKFNKNNS